MVNLSCSLVAQIVKRLPAMWETRVRFLGQEDHLEKEMAIHFSTLAWKTPWTEDPDRLQSMITKSRTRLSDFTFTFTFHVLGCGYKDTGRLSLSSLNESVVRVF